MVPKIKKNYLIEYLPKKKSRQFKRKKSQSNLLNNPYITMTALEQLKLKYLLN